MLLPLCCFSAGILLSALVPVLIRRLASSSSAREVYDDDADAVLLNLEQPATRWFNMGLWAPARSFPDAAAELCRRVAHAARLEPNMRICEVGYGSGDSTLLFEREFSPASYLGLTSLPGQHATAVMRAEKQGLPTGRFELRQGDAAADLDREPDESFDTVLAVDCAYHFNTRVSFLSSAHRLLAPSGRLALTDLLLSEPLSLGHRVLLRLLFFLAGAPFVNFVPPATYRAELVAAGFDAASIEMDDISAEVWPGFCAFVRERDERLGKTGVLGSKWVGLVRYATVVEWYAGIGDRAQKLRFYLISAQKKREKRE
ncbi:hypothetical protein JCM3770_001088 [Rhodotorula araucariae]